MTNLDNYLEDHLAEKAMLEAKTAREKEEQDAFEQMHYQALLANERFDRVKKRMPYARAIAVALTRKTLLPVTLKEDEILVGGISTRFWLSFEEEYTRTHSRIFSGRATGRIRIVTGMYGDRASYPQRKDGTHNYEAIADRLLGHVEHLMKRERSESVAKFNQTAVAEAMNKTGLEHNYGALRLTASAHVDLPVFVTVELKRAMTVEQAVKVHAALKEAGVIK